MRESLYDFDLVIFFFYWRMENVFVRGVFGKYYKKGIFVNYKGEWKIIIKK